MIYLLFICLILTLIINYFLNKKDIISPAFVFTLSFVFSCAWAVLYSQKWELTTFHLNTFLVILGGVIWFSLVCFIVRKIFGKIFCKTNKECVKTELKIIDLNKTLKILCLIFFTIIMYISLKSVIKLVGGSWSNILEALSQYDSINKFSEKQIVLPRIVWIGQVVANAIEYVLVYIMINNFLCTRKLDFVLALDVIVGACINLTTGGRNGFVNVILAIFAIFVLLYKKSSNKKATISKKTKIITIIAIPVIFLIIFPWSVKLMGRKNSKSPMDYLSIYCGAEIKNLDLYLQERANETDKNSGNNQTFIHLIKWIGGNLGYEVNYKLDLPFRNVGNYGLGNVYTTFYQYIYDYGYWGVVFCVGIMAVILQIIYEICLRTKLKGEPLIPIIVYGYMFSSIVFSFFSNKFYEQNFSNVLVYNLIMWIIIKFIFHYREEIINFIKKGINKKIHS